MSSMSSSVSTKRSARRCLFSRADPAVTQQWLNERLEEIRKKQEAKWGFNFAYEIPLPGTSEYTFTPIAEDTVPQFYRAKHITNADSSPTKENRSDLSTSDDSDSSFMDISMSPITPAKREHATPKKRFGKVTDYMMVRRKRLQRSPKLLDIVLPDSERLAARV